ncbi:hypothetical protein GF412_01830 [Candidatus Micrarchaeota archaeon]|nr:hypothetical protein [Candidatus Micrarchaeota archaeon]MBD3417702.1 hypothetical protein [Candidatus Micrarchaeota archaeon]
MIEMLENIDIMGWALIGAFAFFALMVLLIIVYLVWKKGSGSIKFRKKIVEGKSEVLVQPFVNLKRIMVQDKVGGQNIVFVRENLVSGERVWFEYPASNTPARLTTEGDISVTMEAKP